MTELKPYDELTDEDKEKILDKPQNIEWTFLWSSSPQGADFWNDLWDVFYLHRKTTDTYKEAYKKLKNALNYKPKPVKPIEWV